ncbi:hypothetical protein GW17_00020688 [Ensete ventricosum]|nr:hypothetical protein GW17_00020688 [Ensete ventricosum]RZS06737.1 hypothetical protein BHM03_00037450 [Ensete ventricosum]
MREENRPREATARGQPAGGNGTRATRKRQQRAGDPRATTAQGKEVFLFRLLLFFFFLLFLFFFFDPFSPSIDR